MLRKIMSVLLCCTAFIPCWAKVVLSSSSEGGWIKGYPTKVSFPDRSWELQTGLEGLLTSEGKASVEPTTLAVFDATNYRISLGDPRSDPRFKPLREAGFGVDFVSDRHFGKVAVKPISIYAPFGWWCTKRIMDSMWLHVFGIHGDEEGIGTFLEQEVGGTLFRFSLLVLDNRLIEPGQFTIDYGSLPMEKGITGYGYFGRGSEMVILPIGIAVRWLGRYSYDRRMGLGFLQRCGLSLSYDRFRLSYTLIRIPLQFGPWEGGKGEPSRRDVISVGLEGGRFELKCSFTDSWWRKPVYAGESQRRTLKFGGAADYRYRNTGIGFDIGYESRMLASGAHSDTWSCGLHFSTIVKGIECFVSSELSYTVSFSHNLTMIVSWEVDDAHTIEVKVKKTHEVIRVSCSFKRKVSGGSHVVDLDTTAGPSVSCTIDRGG